MEALIQNPRLMRMPIKLPRQTKFGRSPMIDTLAIRADWLLRLARPDCRRAKISNTSPVKVSVKAGRLVWAEVSLPKLLFSHNGRVLACQAEIDSALDRFAVELGRFADTPDWRCWQPWRVDMSWNFDLPARDYTLAHFFTPIPGIRNTPGTYDCGHGLSWKGSHSRFIVRLYNKSREQHEPGDVLRAEVSLCAKQLERRMVGDWHDFNALYHCFRNIMVSIPPIAKPLKARGWQEAVGSLSPEIRLQILANLAHLPERTFRRHASRVNAAPLPASFSWSDLLPADNPPPVVNCEPRNRRKNRP